MSVSSSPPQTNSGVISAGDTRESFFEFSVPLTPEMLELVIGWCTASEVPQSEATGGEGGRGAGAGAGGVSYRDLVMLLNWKVPPGELDALLSKTSPGGGFVQPKLARDCLVYVRTQRKSKWFNASKIATTAISPSPYCMGGDCSH